MVEVMRIVEGRQTRPRGAPHAFRRSKETGSQDRRPSEAVGRRRGIAARGAAQAKDRAGARRRAADAAAAGGGTMKRAIPLGQVYRHLEPGPVVLLTTARGGRDDVMTLSWQTMMDFEPPVIGLILSDRDYSYGLLKAARECVINVPTVELADAVVGAGNCSGRTVDKFARFGLTRTPASLVRPPLIAECYASFECRVSDSSLAAKYGLFVVEAVKAWADPRAASPRTLHHRGRGVFMVAGRTLRLRSRMK
jgi:flavin reductase (DIM6/NTAB) family NADH-FMN oxidoreductase RutF